jgi:hypothetical protein
MDKDLLGIICAAVILLSNHLLNKISYDNGYHRGWLDAYDQLQSNRKGPHVLPEQ